MGTPMQIEQKYTSFQDVFRKRVVQPDQVIKVHRGKEDEALKATQFNGADEVAFKYQGDLYIASGKDLDLFKLGHRKRESKINGQPVQMVRVDDEITSAKEGMKETFNRMVGPGSIEVPFAAIGALVGGAYGALKAVAAPKADKLGTFGQPVKDGPFAP